MRYDRCEMKDKRRGMRDERSDTKMGDMGSEIRAQISDIRDVRPKVRDQMSEDISHKSTISEMNEVINTR